MIYVVPLVVLLGSLVVMLGVAWWQGREPRIPLGRLADPAPLPGELAREAAYGPFPADTGPLLIISEALAANDALEREVKGLIRAAERKIGPVQ
jgi:hypothetical protein